VGTPQNNEKLNQYVNATSPGGYDSNSIIGGSDKKSTVILKNNKNEPRHRRKRVPGVRWKILKYLFIFVAVTVALLWTFQILLLDDIYSAIVLQGMKHNTRTIEKNLESNNLTSIVSYIAKENETCVSVYSITGDFAHTIASSHVTDTCLIHSETNMLADLYTKARNSKDKTYFESIQLKVSSDVFDFNGTGLSDSSMPKSAIYVKAVTFSDGSKGAIFLNRAMTPVSATVKTLTIQLGFISAILIIVAVILAFAISWRVSKPIADVNAEAKKLVGGTYDGSGVCGSYREINELNETLTHVAYELTKVDRMQKELIANISHDLRTPLTMIEGYTEVMRDIPGENTSENLQVIIEETKRLSTLVNDLLEISRFQTGKQQLNMTVFSITDAVRETIVRFDKLNEREGYKIIYEGSGQIYVRADKTRILQVLYNLVGNAINYTGEDKTVIVRLLLRGSRVRVEVQDSGEGIAEKDLPLIWDRYYKIEKANKTHKRGLGGSGLGLSIVKEILLLHNTTFGVSSEEGAGSTFWFELPVMSPPATNTSNTVNSLDETSINSGEGTENSISDVATEQAENQADPNSSKNKNGDVI